MPIKAKVLQKEGKEPSQRGAGVTEAVIRLLKDNPNEAYTQAEVAEAVTKAMKRSKPMTPPHANTILKSLREKGFVDCKEYPNPKTGRPNLYYIWAGKDVEVAETETEAQIQ